MLSDHKTPPGCITDYKRHTKSEWVKWNVGGGTDLPSRRCGSESVTQKSGTSDLQLSSHHQLQIYHRRKITVTLLDDRGTLL